MKHKAAKLTEAVGKKQLVKVRDLVRDGMPLKKAEEIRDRRKLAGQTVADPDFPDDAEEVKFWYVVEVSSAEINRTEESMAIKGEAVLDKAQLEEIAGENGLLSAGLRVAAHGISDNNFVAFAEESANLLSNEGTGGKAKLTRTKPTKAVIDETGDGALQAATPRELAQSACDQVSKDMKDAEGYAMIISAHGLCNETAQSMKAHAEFLKEQYAQLAALVAKDAAVEEYLAPLQAVHGRQRWFDETSPLAKKLVLHVKAKGAGAKKAVKKKKAPAAE